MADDEPMKALEPALQLGHGCGVADAYVAIRAESLAWNGGHMRILKQPPSKLEGVLDAVLSQRDAHVGIDVERSARLGAGYAGDGAQALDHEIAAAAVFLEHQRHGILRAAKRLHGGLLRDGGGVGRGVALELGHGRDYGFWRQSEADAPTGHGISFR